MTLVFHSQAQLCLSWHQIHKLAPLPVPESKHLDRNRTPANFPHLRSKSEQGRCSAAMKHSAPATRAWKGRRAWVAQMWQGKLCTMDPGTRLAAHRAVSIPIAPFLANLFFQHLHSSKVSCSCRVRPASLPSFLSGIRLLLCPSWNHVSCLPADHD